MTKKISMAAAVAGLVNKINKGTRESEELLEIPSLEAYILKYAPDFTADQVETAGKFFDKKYGEDVCRLSPFLVENEIKEFISPRPHGKVLGVWGDFIILNNLREFGFGSENSETIYSQGIKGIDNYDNLILGDMFEGQNLGEHITEVFEDGSSQQYIIPAEGLRFTRAK